MPCTAIPGEPYEFQYNNLLWIAQLKKISSDEFDLDQLWSFNYSSPSPERLCFSFDTVSDKEEFEAFAHSIGQDPKILAKNAVMEKMRALKQKVVELEDKKLVLETELKKLEEEYLKSNIAYYQRRLIELSERLKGEFHETKGNNSWQDWIYQNNWLLGIQYGSAISKQRVGLRSIPDFLFPSLDGFIDILEIKLPKHGPIKSDSSHSGSFVWTNEVIEAIGQVVTYLHEMEINQLYLAKEINHGREESENLSFSTVKPRAFILAGRSNQWKSKEREAFRKLNYSLNGIEVLTYDELILRGENLISLYTKEVIQVQAAG